MSRGVGVLRAERRSKGIDAAERLRVGLAVELSAHGQARLFPEEILRVIHTAVLVLRNIFHI